MRQEQSQECLEQHTVLKNKFESMEKSFEQKLEQMEKKFESFVCKCSDTHDFFFGGTKQKDGQLSFVDKVNIIYETQKAMVEAKKKNKNFFITLLGIFGTLFLCALVDVGVQIHTSAQTSNDLITVMQTQKEIQQEQVNIKLELAQLKAGVGYETHNITLDSRNKSTEQY